MLAYKSSSVHRYGWIPLNPFNWRNVRATVFSSGLIHFQTLLLVLWVLIIHLTGLGVRYYDIYGFLKVWGTVYSGMLRGAFNQSAECPANLFMPARSHAQPLGIRSRVRVGLLGIPTWDIQVLHTKGRTCHICTHRALHSLLSHMNCMLSSFGAVQADACICRAGAVFNLATVVVFFLGLFITLVINRWWSIRTARAPRLRVCSSAQQAV